MELVCISHMRPTADAGVRELSAAGATAVELFLASPAHLDVTDRGQVEATLAALCETGLRVHSAHLCMGEQWDLGHPSEDERRRVAERMILEMRIAAEAGAAKVVAHGGDKKDFGLPRAERVRLCADGMARLMPTAEELGLDVAFENLPPGYPGDTVEELVALVDGLGSARAGFCLDTGHCQIAKGALPEMARAFAGRLHVIHWHDNDGAGDQHEVPGNGSTDWPGFLAALDEVGFDGPVTAEFAPQLAPAEFVRLGQLALDERRAMYV